MAVFRQRMAAAAAAANSGAEADAEANAAGAAAADADAGVDSAAGSAAPAASEASGAAPGQQQPPAACSSERAPGAAAADGDAPAAPACAVLPANLQLESGGLGAVARPCEAAAAPAAAAATASPASTLDGLHVQAIRAAAEHIAACSRQLEDAEQCSGQLLAGLGLAAAAQADTLQPRLAAVAAALHDCLQAEGRS